MKLTSKVIESDKQISFLILKSLAKDLDIYLQNAVRKLEPNIKSIVKNAIIQSPEYQSLIAGKLKYSFGLPDASARLSSILSIWDQIKVEYSKIKTSGSVLTGGFAIYMIKADYSDVLGLPASIFTTEKGSELRWLEWLLLLGDKTIIKEYEIEFGSNPASRTGNAVMKSSKLGKWSVPSEFAGTINDNWITRVLDSIDSIIENEVRKTVKL